MRGTCERLRVERPASREWDSLLTQQRLQLCEFGPNRVKVHLRDCAERGRMHDGLIDPVGDLKMLPFLAVADLIYGELSPDMERALQYLAFSRKYIYTCYSRWSESLRTLQVPPNKIQSDTARV
jgi:hypothetical protein